MTTRKILIVFSSGFGSTAEVARMMANELRALNFEVDVQSADTAGAPYEDEAVIVGRAIRYDRWLPHARHYINRHQEVLAKVSVAYFYSCLTLAAAPSSSTDEEQVCDSGLLDMNPRINPIMVGGFAGTLNYKLMPWYFRLILGWIGRSRGLKAGDYRDWGTIKIWINQFANRI